MTTKWRDLMDDLHGDDPGSVARVDQEKAKLVAEYNRLRWRLVRAWDAFKQKI